MKTNKPVDEGSPEYLKRGRRPNVNALILYPFCFFIANLALIAAVALPSVKPALGALSGLAVTNPSMLEEGDKDIFTMKNEDALPSENDLISPSSDDIPAPGEMYGRIVCENADINAKLYYGDSETELAGGVGTHMGAYIPGAGRAILLAGHNKTAFSGLDDARIGDIIDITTSYGKYKYEVTGSRLELDTDESIYDIFSWREETLVLYTCYPIDAIGITDKRLFVYAKYVSGPRLNLAY
ncbi:MAG: class D sortase [Clostridiales bacterium]|jgi:sortase A|nr:class D sortase [Clostridiales bacterium]